MPKDNKTPSKTPSKTPMTADDARRIQSNADKTGTNKEFKARAQSAADRNKKGGN